MDIPEQLHLRDTRDRVIDLLGLGRTAPLRDVTVEPHTLVVPVGTQAEIGIDPGQVDVRYLLRHRDGSTIGPGFHRRGNGGRTAMATPPVDEKITYRLLARKIRPSGETPRETYLHQVVEMTAGLDAALPARILAPVLEPGDGDAAPRIVDYGQQVNVEIDRSQSGVFYELVEMTDGEPGAIVSDSPVVGDQGSIVVVSRSMIDDVELRVRAGRRPAADNADGSEETLLDAVLSLKVRADTSLVPAVPEPIVGHLTVATLELEDAQSGVTYQVVGRALSRPDFLYGEAHELDVVVVAVPGTSDVQIRRPRRDRIPDELAPIGTERTGAGDRLDFDLGAVENDMVLVVLATKDHGPASTTVQLAAAAAVLVRPDLNRLLSLVVPITDSSVSGLVEVSGGQPGVQYAFLRPSDLQLIDVPVFFPEPDSTGDPVGIEMLRIEVDWHVVGETGDARQVDLDATLPVRYAVRAVKARTGVDVASSLEVLIPDEPVIGFESNPIPVGSVGRIIVTASVEGERYQPFVGAEPLKAPRIGNGSDLVFLTGPIAATTTITMRVTSSPDHPGHKIERHIDLVIGVE